MQEYLWEHAYTSEVKMDHRQLGLCVLANHFKLADLIAGALITHKFICCSLDFRTRIMWLCPFPEQQHYGVSYVAGILQTPASWSTSCLHGISQITPKQNRHIRKHAASSMMLYLHNLDRDLSWVCFSAIGKLARNVYPQLFLYFTFFFAQWLSAKNLYNSKMQAPS